MSERTCDVCHKESWGFSLMGFMPWCEKQLDPHVKVCLECSDTPPCGKGSWYDGQLTCPHGYKFTKHADWVVVGEQASLEWRLVGYTWWRKVKNFFGIKGHS